MAEQSFVQASEYARQAKRDRIAAAASERQAREALETTDRLRPGFFARLFGARVYKAWRIEIEALLQNKSLAHNELIRAQNVESSAARVVEAARRNISKCEAEKQKADTALASILSTIEKFRPLFGKNFANEDFWAQDEDRRQLLSPWISNEFQAARDTLFVETFALHRAFIDAAAKPLRHNLRVALEVMKGRVLKEQQEPARRSLWASLFLVVPVISTTFASTSRLFGALGREQLGWLLIDEAGQAMPQAAVGALLRAKRAIVIGDPLQIQPVVPMAPKLIRAIFREFGVDTERWAAPDMSAQTLADRMSWFGTDIITDDGDIWVGSPLRVHRRCKNPMFRISNHVAYNGPMVYGTPDGSSEIGRILGESLWIDVRGEATGKWCDTEGQAAVSLLRRLLGSGLDDPDIFFITPFAVTSNPVSATRVVNGTFRNIERLQWLVRYG